MNLDSLLYALPDLTNDDADMIARAYHKAEARHSGQVRKSGEPYFSHCVAVAQILADMKLDAEAISAALMHDLIEDTDVTHDELKCEFNEAVANLVDGVSKLTKLPIAVDIHGDKRSRTVDRDLEYFRKMLMMMGDDVRVVLIKLADRLHNMRTLHYMKPEKQVKTARETMEIFAPLANRLGIWQIKWELEDLSFRYLQPDAYKMLAASLAERRTDREAYIEDITENLELELDDLNIEKPSIIGRPKHIYSIYKKMVRKNVPFSQIYDVRAVRVIVNTVPECYLVLGIVHNLWRPIPGEFDDYIASPKDNFYQSLHTAVLDSNGKTVEIQIRTWDMHEHAEYGVAAHWRYKEGKNRDEAFDRRISYLRRLMEFGNEDEDAHTFMENMKSEVFEARVYIFTPKGEIIDLPEGATTLDFAYHIHTEIGHQCRGAKVGGKFVPLDYQLKTGDQVEIITNKHGKPSLDWLNADLGYIKSSRARAKVRHWFRQQNRERNINEGRTLLDQELKRYALTESTSYDHVAHLFNYDKPDDLLASIGSGEITGAQISNKLLDTERKTKNDDDSANIIQTKRSSALRINPNTGTTGVQVTGSGGGYLVNLGRCCQPVVGDDIIGFITRGRGITVHRTDCMNVLASTEPERLIEVNWTHDDDKQCYAVAVEVIAYDREGLLRDVSTMIADAQINITNVNVVTKSSIATLDLTMELSHIRQLGRILTKIQSIPNVVEARRKHAT